MTAALLCYGMEGGETVEVVKEGWGITVLNPQMEFCSLSLWNNLAGLLSLYTVMSFSFLCFQTLSPQIRFIFVLKIVFFVFAYFKLFYNGYWKVAGRIGEGRGQ